jgi:hypothetical protein
MRVHVAVSAMPRRLPTLRVHGCPPRSGVGLSAVNAPAGQEIIAETGCRLLHQAQDGPKSPCAGMTLYQVLHELQIVLAVILGACPLCRQPVTPDRLAADLTGT